MPDPILTTSIHCPHCQVHTSIEPATMHTYFNGRECAAIAFWVERPNRRWWIGVCNYCRRPVLVLGNGEVFYPNQAPSPTDESIPENIRNDLDEAKLCLTVQAWRAVAVMARRTIQTTAIDKGATKSVLHEQIAELASMGVITAEIKNWADVVRWVGNDGAHPGKNTVEQQDAEDILHLAEQLLHVVYVTPSVANSLRKAKGK